MNNVEINEAALTAEADAAMTAAAELEPVPPSPDAQAADAVSGDSWAPLVAGVMPMLCIGVFPQWGITDAERTEFGEALGQCLDQIFPGGLNGKYACWVRLIAAGGGIVAVRYLQAGTLPPIGPKRVTDAAATENTQAKTA